MKQIKGGSHEDFLNTIGMTEKEYERYSKDNYTSNPVITNDFVVGNNYEYNGIVVECISDDAYGDDECFIGRILIDPDNDFGINTKQALGKGFYKPPLKNN